MSARRPPVAFTPDARNDLRGILLYTRRQWGEAPRDVYRAEIYRVLEMLRANPELGRPRDDLRPGRRSFPVRQHVIHYRIEDGRVVVLRILHGRMDAAGHLTSEGDEVP